jgi:hypothetical protein
LGRLLAPHTIQQVVNRDQPIGVHQQSDQNTPLPNMANGNALTVDAGLDIAEQSKLDGHLYRHPTQPVSKCQPPRLRGGTYLYALKRSDARPVALTTTGLSSAFNERSTLGQRPGPMVASTKSVGQIGERNARKK